MTIHEETKDLKALSNSTLFEEAKSRVKNETGATIHVLHVLREIDRRRAFAEKEYPSLFEFCVEYLGYKRDAAYRRIAAMRVLKDLPELEEKVISGEVKLMTLTQAQSHFDYKRRVSSPLTKKQKMDLIASVQFKSVRESEKIFAQLTPIERPNERFRSIDSQTDELRIATPKRFREKIEKLKMFMGAEKAGVETVEVLEKGLDAGIKEYEFRTKNSVSKGLNQKILKNTELSTTKSSPMPDDHEFAALGKTGRYISISVRRQVWQRDKGQCAFVNPENGNRCCSRFKLEIDHIKPKALGGGNDLSNLRLVCRSHNQIAAIDKLGLETMSRYLT